MLFSVNMKEIEQDTRALVHALPKNIVFRRGDLDGQRVDLHVENGTLARIRPSSAPFPNLSSRRSPEPTAWRDNQGRSGSEPVTADLCGAAIFPLITDVHTHLREPGQEYKEGLVNGMRAALFNGICRLAMMANTNPPLDDPALVTSVLNKIDGIKEDTGIDPDVYVNAAASLGLAGEERAPFASYPQGVRAVSDDGRTIEDLDVLERIFGAARENDLTVMSHCEDPEKVGYMERTDETLRLGIPSTTEEKEAIIVERNLNMAERTGCRLHICHVSSVEGVEAISEAKERGLPVTCEATPHHLFLSTDDIDHRDGFYRVNPPLRRESTRRYLLKALLDGKIDMIATDHAPHAMEEKRRPVSEAAPGFSGLDTLFLNIYTHLYKPGKIDMEGFERLTSRNPAALLSVRPWGIREGDNTSFMVMEEGDFVLKGKHLLSAGKNNPFVGRRFAGRIRAVIWNGRIFERRYAD